MVAAAMLLALLPGAAALTLANQTQALLTFKEEVLKRGPGWEFALKVSREAGAAAAAWARLGLNGRDCSAVLRLP